MKVEILLNLWAGALRQTPHIMTVPHNDKIARANDTEWDIQFKLLTWEIQSFIKLPLSELNQNSE